MQLILASNSPRRKQILIESGYDFKVIPSDYEEKEIVADPKELVKIYSFNKANSVYQGLTDKRDILVLGSDTIVVLDGKILGKPKDKQHAFSMLKSLSNKTHQVISGYALIGMKFSLVDLEVTKVTFNELSDAEIKEYIEKMNPLDKAGAYGIQDGYPLVKSYEGSYNNIVGLPIESIAPLLNKFLEKGEEK